MEKSMQSQAEFELIIMKNILYLARNSKQYDLSQRNLLNKWFQDTVKNYIMEQLASQIICKHLNCQTPQQVKKLIRQNVDKSKPIFLSIIEIYFQFINQFNEKEAFIQKLNDTLESPQDITLGKCDLDYKTQRNVRKQFVCLLLLKFFEFYGKLEIKSFFQLWNMCYPQEIQVKKKLSRFDQKNKIKKFNIQNTRIFNQKSSPCILQNDLSSSTYYSQSDVISQEILVLFPQQSTNNDFQCIQNNLKAKKMPINNHIFDEESYEEDLSLNYFGQVNYCEVICQKQEECSNENCFSINENILIEKQNQQIYQEHYFNEPSCYEQTIIFSKLES